MVKLIVTNIVKADCLDKYLACSGELVKATNAHDKGCLQYELYRDVKDPLRFVMLEEWESQADLDAHAQAEHYTRLVPQMGACCEQGGGAVFLEKVRAV